MRKITVLICVTFSVFSQNERDIDSIYFSEMLAIHHSDYQKKSELDFYSGNHDVSEKYFINFVDTRLKGTLLDNFKVSSFDDTIEFMYQFKRPFYLMTYSSWCVPSNGELEALKQLMSEHASWMDFVLIMWDKKEDAIKFSKQFHPKTKVIYVNELYNTETKTIKLLKHKLGVPVSLTISTDKRILNIRKNTQVHPSVDVEVATKTVYDAISKDISLLQDFENL